MSNQLETVTVNKMRMPFFVDTDRNRRPIVVLVNKVPMGLYIPCEFDQYGVPDIESICQQIRDMTQSPVDGQTDDTN